MNCSQLICNFIELHVFNFIALFCNFIELYYCSTESNCSWQWIVIATPLNCTTTPLNETVVNFSYRGTVIEFNWSCILFQNLMCQDSMPWEGLWDYTSRGCSIMNFHGQNPYSNSSWKVWVQVPCFIWRNVATIFARSDTTATHHAILLNESDYLSKAAFIKLSVIGNTLCKFKGFEKNQFYKKVQWLEMPGSQSKETLPRLSLLWIASSRNQILSQMLKMTKMSWRRINLYWRTANLFY